MNEKKICSILLALMLVFALAACSGGDKDDAKDADTVKPEDVAGVYEGQYTKFVGDPDSAKDDSEPFSLELNADGTGTHNRDDMSFDVTWEIDGENFTMKETFVGDPIVYTGTLKDGHLNIFNGDPEDDFTCEYVYVLK